MQSDNKSLFEVQVGLCCKIKEKQVASTLPTDHNKVLVRYMIMSKRKLLPSSLLHGNVQYVHRIKLLEQLH